MLFFSEANEHFNHPPDSIKATDLITVTNKRQDRVVGVFDYPELCEYM
ncbi:13103_t:CDS:2, partial [Funneliformis geosporum]